jgi:hypothetical protein
MNLIHLSGQIIHLSSLCQVDKVFVIRKKSFEIENQVDRRQLFQHEFSNGNFGCTDSFLINNHALGLAQASVH